MYSKWLLLKDQCTASGCTVNDRGSAGNGAEQAERAERASGASGAMGRLSSILILGASIIYYDLGASIIYYDLGLACLRRRMHFLGNSGAKTGAGNPPHADRWNHRSPENARKITKNHEKSLENPILDPRN